MIFSIYICFPSAQTAADNQRRLSVQITRLYVAQSDNYRYAYGNPLMMITSAYFHPKRGRFNAKHNTFGLASDTFMFLAHVFNNLQPKSDIKGPL